MNSNLQLLDTIDKTLGGILLLLADIVEGGPGSGNFGHSGIPGQQGGSESSSSGAADKVGKLTFSGGDIGDIEFTQDEKELLSQTVKGDYKVYRGIGVINSRVTQEQMQQIKSLRPGDKVPDFLMKQGNPYASYSKSPSVAKRYSEGKIRLITQAEPSQSQIIVDTTNIPKVEGLRDEFSQSDLDYFKSEREVIIEEPSGSVVYWTSQAPESKLQESNRKLTIFFRLLEGGPTSGNWGHSSVPGQHGGSAPGGGHAKIGAEPGASRQDIINKSQDYRGTQKSEEPKGPSRFKNREDLNSYLEKKVDWDINNREVTVVRGGRLPDEGPSFFTSVPEVATGYGEGRQVGVYKIQMDRILVAGTDEWYEAFGEDAGTEWEEMGLELYSDPPDEMLSALSNIGMVGYASYGGDLIRVEQEGAGDVETLEVIPGSEIPGETMEFEPGQDLPDIKLEYQDVLNNTMLDYLTSPGAPPITAFRNEFRRAVNDAFTTTFYTGWGDAQGGEVPPEALDWLQSKIESEIGYADTLFQDLKGMRKDMAPDEVADWIDYRSEGYTHTLDGIYDESKIRGALEMPLTFGGDDGEESCSTCQSLKGETHPASWWVENGLIPGQSGNENFECLGYRCQHVLLDPEGNVYSAESAELVLREIWYLGLFEGGPSSGNWGHSGVSGVHGGSAPGGGLSRVGAEPGSSRDDIVNKSLNFRSDREEAKNAPEAPPPFKGGRKSKVPKGLDPAERRQFIADNLTIETRSTGTGKIGVASPELRAQAAALLAQHSDPAVSSFLRHGELVICTDDKAFGRMYGNKTLQIEGWGQAAAYYRGANWLGGRGEMVFRQQYFESNCFAHELGHFIQDHSPLGHTWTEEYNAHTGFDRLTSYSKRNDHEGFAETYEAWTGRGSPKPDEMTGWIDPRVGSSFPVVAAITKAVK